MCDKYWSSEEDVTLSQRTWHAMLVSLYLIWRFDVRESLYRSHLCWTILSEYCAQKAALRYLWQAPVHDCSRENLNLPAPLLLQLCYIQPGLQCWCGPQLVLAFHFLGSVLCCAFTTTGIVRIVAFTGEKNIAYDFSWGAQRETDSISDIVYQDTLKSLKLCMWRNLCIPFGYTACATEKNSLGLRVTAVLWRLCVQLFNSPWTNKLQYGSWRFALLKS